MDIRVKTFVAEAASRLEFLRAEHGFAGPEVVDDEAGVYPLMRRVRYRRDDVAFEITLVLSYMGEEHVDTSMVSEDESGSARRTQVKSDAAHTGYQMRHALERQAEAVRKVLGERTPSRRN
ncbi:MAG TPA: hypothetical protein VLM11_10300 [Streptosporangiaceae bacterium]|nr:hypothetical protein [Streptosporangiaceae bacterium]